MIRMNTDHSELYLILQSLHVCQCDDSRFIKGSVNECESGYITFHSTSVKHVVTWQVMYMRKTLFNWNYHMGLRIQVHSSQFKATFNRFLKVVNTNSHTRFTKNYGPLIKMNDPKHKPPAVYSWHRFEYWSWLQQHSLTHLLCNTTLCCLVCGLTYKNCRYLGVFHQVSTDQMVR